MSGKLFLPEKNLLDIHANSELKDGYLPDKIYMRGCHARYDIELAILLTTLRKACNVLLPGKSKGGLVMSESLAVGLMIV